ncbi:MAG: hypothetical protein E6J64_19845 [Deltaproteobacteria bacterium]|nr:MAG: hypothetical protein E6J64_19845 [Deltaproteobacteria bacterium]
MSHEPSHSTEHLPPPEAQADEHVASFKIVAVGVIALLVFGAATVWSARILDRTARTLSPAGPLPVGKEIGKPEIGIVDQTPFETTRGSEKYRREALQRLNSYGWVDPQKGVIHVPIDKAIDQLLSQEQGKKP